MSLFLNINHILSAMIFNLFSTLLAFISDSNNTPYDDVSLESTFSALFPLKHIIQSSHSVSIHNDSLFANSEDDDNNPQNKWQLVLKEIRIQNYILPLVLRKKSTSSLTLSFFFTMIIHKLKVIATHPLIQTSIL